MFGKAKGKKREEGWVGEGKKKEGGVGGGRQERKRGGVGGVCDDVIEKK